MTTTDEIRRLANAIDAFPKVPPFPESTMVWQIGSLHNILRDTLNAAASEPGSPTVGVLVELAKEYIAAISRALATAETFEIRE